MASLLRIEPTERERFVIISVARNQPFDVARDEWKESALLSMTAAYTAIGDVWTDDRNADLITFLRLRMTDEDPAIVAGAAIRAATLHTWWSDATYLIDPEVQTWARLATDTQPSSILGWFLLSECWRARGNFREVTKIAERLAGIPIFVAPTDPFEHAFEVLFTGRPNWNAFTAQEFLDQARADQSAAENLGAP